MTLVTARVDGWPALRYRVFTRDGMCIAKREDIFGEDVATDQCRDWQLFFITPDFLDAMEFDHVRERSGGNRFDDEAHGVTACPWHHRLAVTWRTDSMRHRAVLRDHLRTLYPDVWVG